MPKVDSISHDVQNPFVDGKAQTEAKSGRQYLDSVAFKSEQASANDKLIYNEPNVDGKQGKGIPPKTAGSGDGWLKRAVVIPILSALGLWKPEVEEAEPAKQAEPAKPTQLQRYQKDKDHALSALITLMPEVGSEAHRGAIVKLADCVQAKHGNDLAKAFLDLMTPKIENGTVVMSGARSAEVEGRLSMLATIVSIVEKDQSLDLDEALNAVDTLQSHVPDSMKSLATLLSQTAARAGHADAMSLLKNLAATIKKGHDSGTGSQSDFGKTLLKSLASLTQRAAENPKQNPYAVIHTLGSLAEPSTVRPTSDLNGAKADAMTEIVQNQALRNDIELRDNTMASVIGLANHIETRDGKASAQAFYETVKKTIRNGTTDDGHLTDAAKSFLDQVRNLVDDCDRSPSFAPIRGFAMLLSASQDNVGERQLLDVSVSSLLQTDRLKVPDSLEVEAKQRLELFANRLAEFMPDEGDDAEFQAIVIVATSIYDNTLEGDLDAMERFCDHALEALERGNHGDDSWDKVTRHFLTEMLALSFLAEDDPDWDPTASADKIFAKNQPTAGTPVVLGGKKLTGVGIALGKISDRIAQLDSRDAGETFAGSIREKLREAHAANKTNYVQDLLKSVLLVADECGTDPTLDPRLNVIEPRDPTKTSESVKPQESEKPDGMSVADWLGKIQNEAASLGPYAVMLGNLAVRVQAISGVDAAEKFVSDVVRPYNDFETERDNDSANKLKRMIASTYRQSSGDSAFDPSNMDDGLIGEMVVSRLLIDKE